MSSSAPDTSQLVKETFFSVPSAPAPSIKKDIFTHTLRVQAWIEIRSEESIQDFEDCTKILEPWIDEASCPIWQYIIDSWVFFCMGVHARKDPLCTTHCLYRARIDQVLEFKHNVEELDPALCKAVTVRFVTAYNGKKCEVSFWSSMTPSRRRGAPFFIMYYAPLKDGNPPPAMMKWKINLPFKILNDTEEGPYLSK